GAGGDGAVSRRAVRVAGEEVGRGAGGVDGGVGVVVVGPAVRGDAGNGQREGADVGRGGGLRAGELVVAQAVVVERQAGDGDRLACAHVLGVEGAGGAAGVQGHRVAAEEVGCGVGSIERGAGGVVVDL